MLPGRNPRVSAGSAFSVSFAVDQGGGKPRPYPIRDRQATSCRVRAGLAPALVTMTFSVGYNDVPHWLDGFQRGSLFPQEGGYRREVPVTPGRGWLVLCLPTRKRPGYAGVKCRMTFSSSGKV